MELRISGVEQLGQVRLAILETNGQISLYFYEDDDVKAGLSILPSRFTDRFTTIPRGRRVCLRSL
ncbi:inner membrane protein [Klebsiella michiganensis]|nr:inner membrane protein [Klebsiella michiganensis]